MWSSRSNQGAGTGRHSATTTKHEPEHLTTTNDDANDDVAIWPELGLPKPSSWRAGKSAVNYSKLEGEGRRRKRSRKKRKRKGLRRRQKKQNIKRKNIVSCTSVNQQTRSQAEESYGISNQQAEGHTATNQAAKPTWTSNQQAEVHAATSQAAEPTWPPRHKAEVQWKNQPGTHNSQQARSQATETTKLSIQEAEVQMTSSQAAELTGLDSRQEELLRRTLQGKASIPETPKNTGGPIICSSQEAGWGPRPAKPGFARTTIFTNNVRGYSCKKESVEKYVIECMRPDVINLSETLLRNKARINHKDYFAFCQNRPDGAGGGGYCNIGIKFIKV